MIACLCLYDACLILAGLVAVAAILSFLTVAGLLTVVSWLGRRKL